MGELGLNLEAVKHTIQTMKVLYPNVHQYVSTIGIKGVDYSWVKDNITLQLSLHSLDEEKRNWLIPYKKKNTIEELGKIRTKSNLKTTLNMTLVDEQDFDIEELKKHFDKENFFVKISPINPNSTSEKNQLGNGAITGINIL